MIRVTVELLPGGDDSRAVELAVMKITNVVEDFSMDDEYGDYSVQAAAHAPNGDVMLSQRGGVLHHPRRRYNVWGLIYAAIESLGSRGTEADPTGTWHRPPPRRTLWKQLNP